MAIDVLEGLVSAVADAAVDLCGEGCVSTVKDRNRFRELRERESRT
jgi:hypothetical protein